MIINVKNNIDIPVMIDDLGIEIPINEIIELSDLFFIFEILSSKDLKENILMNKLIINNGESNLTIEKSLEYLNFYI